MKKPATHEEAVAGYLSVDVDQAFALNSTIFPVE
jgi:hypothetical protein